MLLTLLTLELILWRHNVKQRVEGQLVLDFLKNLWTFKSVFILLRLVNSKVVDSIPL